MKYEFNKMILSDKAPTVAFVKADIDNKYSVWVSVIKSKEGGLFCNLPSRKFFDKYEDQFAIHHFEDRKNFLADARMYYTRLIAKNEQKADAVKADVKLPPEQEAVRMQFREEEQVREYNASARAFHRAGAGNSDDMPF